jgi:hypothetical protein
MFQTINMSAYAFPIPVAPANPYRVHPQPVPSRHFTFKTVEPPMLPQSNMMNMNPVPTSQPFRKQEGYMMEFAPTHLVDHTPINPYPQKTRFQEYFPNSV